MQEIQCVRKTRSGSQTRWSSFLVPKSRVVIRFAPCASGPAKQESEPGHRAVAGDFRCLAARSCRRDGTDPRQPLIYWVFVPSISVGFFDTVVRVSVGADGR